ncbi:hypothetical protein EON65_01340 [archaeon]|nr:MAG: hypothetical protein EON65_01340 [archaeon]
MLQTLEQYRRYAETLPKAEDQQPQMSILDQILRDQAGTSKDNGDKASSNKTASVEVVADDSAPAEPAIQYGTNAWTAMMSKFNFKMPNTDLEKDKLAFYEQGSLYTLEELKSEEEAEDFVDDLVQSQVIVQAKLQKEFDNKEAARRRTEWAKREVWGAEEFLTPLLPAQDDQQD